MEFKGSVADFIRVADEDIDVYDDYDERCGCAYCPPTCLTELGEARFARALNLDCVVHDGVCSVECPTAKDASAVAELFEAIAGYCSSEDWDAWFYYPVEEKPNGETRWKVTFRNGEQTREITVNAPGIIPAVEAGVRMHVINYPHIIGWEVVKVEEVAG